MNTELRDRVLPWILSQIADSRQPLTIGISGPQGSGKSTLVRQLVEALEVKGLKAAAISLDDFYLTREEQLALAAVHPNNPYLAHRGYPGTHDVELGVEVLDKLRALKAGERLELPSYDKSAHGGRGDRAPNGPVVSGPLTVILFEGWMLGFQPVSTPPSDPALRTINSLLGAYQPLNQRIDRMVILSTADPETIVRWRVGAEAARAASGKPALDRAAITDYIRSFLPAYALYGSTVANGPWTADQVLRLTLGEDRLPVR